jgi:hypothetical protein
VEILVTTPFISFALIGTPVLHLHILFGNPKFHWKFKADAIAA